MAKFTFPVRKAEKINGHCGYEYEVKMDGKTVTSGWTAGTKRDAVQQAKMDAEAYGWLDE